MYRLFILLKFAFYTSVLQATGAAGVAGVVGTYWATTFTLISFNSHGSPGMAKQKPVTSRPVLQELTVVVLGGVVKLTTLYPKVWPKVGPVVASQITTAMLMRLFAHTLLRLTVSLKIRPVHNKLWLLLRSGQNSQAER